MHWLPGEQTIIKALPLGVRRGLRLEVGWWRGERVLSKTLLHGGADYGAAFEREAAIAAGLCEQSAAPQWPLLLARTERQLIFRWRDGLTLRAVLGQGDRRLGLPQSLSLGLGLLRVLQELHGAGAVHHDVKPENILLARWQPSAWPTPGQVTLLDFDQSWAAWLPDLPEGTRMGTPHYMPPEQFAGVRGDPRSDLYAAGAVLFEALCGEPPRAQPLPWLLGYCCAPVSLSGVPPVLQSLLKSLLARDPHDRPDSAAEALAALREVVRELGLALE